MQTEWIAVDWGTSNLRVWVFGPDGAELAHVSGGKGMGGLQPKDFEPTLIAMIDAHLPHGRKTPVIACGMVGAKQGWIEAPYTATPCAIPGIGAAVQVHADDPRLDMRILPGVMQASPADVMRGEETQMGGFLTNQPDFDGVICLPGTHTKWVRISAGEIIGFRTVMTGEIFAVLSNHSVLRHSVGGDGWDQAAFDAGVADAIMSPQYLTSRLFGLRAGSLLDGDCAAISRARMSGLLLGLEMAGTREYWLGQDVALIGEPRLTTLYAAALAPQGVNAREYTGDEFTLAGLKAAYAGLKG
jgi:2-dehydro-3-deoxygalactonokinase